MPRTKKLPKGAQEDCTVVLKDGRIEEVSGRPELTVLLELHLRPVTAEWAYLQRFNDLLACYAMLNQVGGSLSLVNVALAMEQEDPVLAAAARKQLQDSKAMERNVEASLEAVAQVLRERGFRRA